MKDTLRSVAFGTAAILLTGAAPAFAHHGDAGRYEDTVSTVTGKVVEFQFVNPHSVIVLDVTTETGDVERWSGELGSPGSLAKNWGWNRSTIKPGETLTITGRKRKNGEPYMTLSEGARVLDANGKELFRGGDLSYPQS
jgi:hypothetical protein